MKKKPNKVRTIQGVYDVKLERLPRILYSSGGEYRSEHDMTQHERCGGGRRIVRKRTTGGNY